MGLAMAAAQPPLVAPDPLGDVLRRAVEGGIGVGGSGLTLDQNVAANMHGEVRADERTLAREHDMGLDRLFEVLVDDAGERRLDMLTQGLADVDLLTCDGKLHGVFCLPGPVRRSLRETLAPPVKSGP